MSKSKKLKVLGVPVINALRYEDKLPEVMRGIEASLDTVWEVIEVTAREIDRVQAENTILKALIRKHDRVCSPECYCIRGDKEYPE